MTTGLIAIAVALTISISTIGPGLGMGQVGGKAMEGMSRQPEMMGQLRTNMILAYAFMESLTIYGLVLAFMLLAKM
ncbi:MAG: ATP synthase F0 subunit C [Firmicutes bacterium]|nr:ATP synthase F0 subunit C [Bacillota bacterium]MCF0144042.1 ATP synthase F0 subunit C [Bacillota bacterium]